MAGTDIGLGGLDWPRVLVGLLVFLSPGFTWAWAVLRHLGWARLVPIAIVLAFTIEPAAMLLLNLVFGVPVTLATGVYLSATMALLGLAVGLRDRIEALVRV